MVSKIKIRICFQISKRRICQLINIHILNFFIQVASASRIKQWNDVKLEDGMASLELQLSKEPILGRYTITAFVGVSLLFM